MMKRLTAAALAATLGFFAFSTTPAQAGDPEFIKGFEA